MQMEEQKDYQSQHDAYFQQFTKIYQDFFTTANFIQNPLNPEVSNPNVVVNQDNNQNTEFQQSCSALPPTNLDNFLNKNMAFQQLEPGSSNFAPLQNNMPLKDINMQDFCIQTNKGQETTQPVNNKEQTFSVNQNQNLTYSEFQEKFNEMIDEPQLDNAESNISEEFVPQQQPQYQVQLQASSAPREQSIPHHDSDPLSNRSSLEKQYNNTNNLRYSSNEQHLPTVDEANELMYNNGQYPQRVSNLSDLDNYPNQKYYKSFSNYSPNGCSRVTQVSTQAMTPVQQYMTQQQALVFSKQDVFDIKKQVSANIAEKIFDYLKPNSELDKKRKNIKNAKRLAQLHNQDPNDPNELQINPYEKPRSLMAKDGDVFESQDLDCIFKILYNREVLGQHEIPDALLPPHARQNLKAKYSFLRRWIHQGLFRLVKATDPELGFFAQFGRFGYASYHKLAEGEEEPMAEYELHRYMHDSWREVPHKKHYERLMYETHTGSHIGENQTIQNLMNRFTWPHQKEYVRSFITDCTVCGLKKPKPNVIRRAPNMFMYEENPLDRIQADLIKVGEGLKEPDCMYQYILTVVDHHSKKAWAKCLKNKTSRSISQLLGKLFDKIFNTRGCCPRLLHTDNGTEFRNQILKQICKEKDIKQIMGAPYHSQSQGLVERFNRTVQDQLTFYRQNLMAENVVKPGKSYEIKSALREILKAYNNRIHSTIKITPNEAYFQIYIQSKRLRNLTPEEIRQYVVSNTQHLGHRLCHYKSYLAVGDPVLIKSTLRIKIRLDGTRLIIPPKENHRHCRYRFRATVKEVRGNCYHLYWGEDSPELGLVKGQIVYNVPINMMVKDIAQVQMHKFLQIQKELEAKDECKESGDFKAPYLSGEKTLTRLKA